MHRGPNALGISPSPDWIPPPRPGSERQQILAAGFCACGIKGPSQPASVLQASASIPLLLSAWYAFSKALLLSHACSKVAFTLSGRPCLMWPVSCFLGPSYCHPALCPQVLLSLWPGTNNIATVTDTATHSISIFYRPDMV